MSKIRQLVIVLCVLTGAAFGQLQRVQKFCELGGQNVVTQGLNSTTNVQRSFPKCTVTVFLTGTSTIATIFSDALSTPLANPFTANTDGSFGFFAATTACYDVVTSAGNPGNQFPNPFTYTDVCLGSGGGGGAPGPTTQLFKSVPNCTANGTVLNQTVQESTQVVSGITVACATVGVAGSTSIIGVCSNQGTCGNTGTALVLTNGTGSLILDNQGVGGDYIIQSPTINGFGSDFGNTKPTTVTETLGIVALPNVGGAGNAAQAQIAPLSILLPGATGTGSINNCTQVGAIAYYSGLNILSCDLKFTTDGAGHWTALSGRFLDSSQSGFFDLIKGPTLPTQSDSNAIYFSVSPSFGATFGIHPPDSAPTAGHCVQWAAGDATNWFVPADAGAPCGTSSTAFQVNGTATSAQSPINFQNSFDMTFSNPSAGNIQVREVGDGQLGTPTAPTATVNGTPATTDYKYAVVGCQDPNCVYHTAISGITDVPTGAATLTSTNSITLSAYGDTFYGVRGYIICRTSSSGTPSTVGAITSTLIAGKKFIDTGLAGSGINCATTYATNTTITLPACLGSALPGTPTTPGFPCGVDGPPLTPNAADDECTQTFGSIGDINDPFWTLVNFGSATGSWSNGACVLISDTTASNNLEMMTQTLPSTPYTYLAQISMKATSTFGGCAIGFRESSSSKVSGVLNYQNVALSVGTASPVGHGMSTFTGTNSTTLTLVSTNNYMGDQYYYKVKNDGTNLTYSYSPDGVDFRPYPTISDSTTWTSAPNQLFVAVNSAATTASCAIDYVRRIQ